MLVLAHAEQLVGQRMLVQMLGNMLSGLGSQIVLIKKRVFEH